mmetsp:Transcript_46732/g.53902  ORF Transcript_46732/g.53902 Transcript_46732/m.53902 type:complete len:413 (+) Transcript_46732:34-1272(+)
MTARPLLSVFNAQNPTEILDSVPLPTVFTAPIRNDIVHFVHYNIAKNTRQAYAVSLKAGHQHSAESWGPGRAVARIPRVSGSGTHRAGQGAFGNMCRKGRMFAPTKVWRRWHRRVNVTQKRHAVASAIAASAVPALVMARGHKVNSVSELPLVIDNFAHVEKARDLVTVLKAIGAYEDVVRAKNSKKLRRGKGKLRNRRYTQRRGPLLIHNEDSDKLKNAGRNIPGLEVQNVHRMNLRSLAPGGSLGRFVIWTKSAVKALDDVFGTYRKVSAEKVGYHLQRPMMTNADLARIINSNAIQSVARPAQAKQTRGVHQKKNPLKNAKAMNNINPYERLRKHIARVQLKKRATELEKLRKEKRGITAALSKKEKTATKQRKTASTAWLKSVTEHMTSTYYDPTVDEDEQVEAADEE